MCSCEKVVIVFTCLDCKINHNQPVLDAYQEGTPICSRCEMEMEPIGAYVDTLQHAILAINK